MSEHLRFYDIYGRGIKDELASRYKVGYYPNRAYSVVVYKHGNYVIAEKSDGTLLSKDTDAATVIQNAIDELTSGGTVLIKKGLYEISDSILVNNNGIKLIGETYWNGTSSLDATPQVGLYLADGVNKTVIIITSMGCKVSNIFIHGNAANNTAGEGIRVIGDVANYNTIENVFVYYTYYAGMVLSRSSAGVVVKNCVIYKARLDGIQILGAKNALIEGNTIYGAGVALNNTYAGISLSEIDTHYTTHCIVTHNRIYSNETNKPKYGITEETTSEDYNLIIGNIITDYVTSAINLQGANSVSANNIT